MLVVSRKVNQTVELPGLGVVIRVTELKRSRVQLGIEAPATVRVRRGETARRGCESATEPGPLASGTWEDGTRAISGMEAGERGHDWGDELQRMELQIAALAELANAHDRQIARQVAGDAIDRLGGIRRRIAAAWGGAREPGHGTATGETRFDGILDRGRMMATEEVAEAGIESGSVLEGAAEVRQKRAGYLVEAAA